MTENLPHYIAFAAICAALLVAGFMLMKKDEGLTKVRRLHSQCCDSTSPHWNDCDHKCRGCKLEYPCPTIQLLDESEWTRGRSH